MLRERRECDVYGTTKDVRQYRVQILQFEAGQPVVNQGFKVCDLSPRALKRLVNFIERGLSKATPKASAGAEA